MVIKRKTFLLFGLIVSFSLVYLLSNLIISSSIVLAKNSNSSGKVLQATTIEPVNPNATAQAKQVLNWLANLPNRTNNRVISGQHAAAWDFVNNYDKYITSVYQESGKWIALVGADYGFATWDEPGQNSKLIEHWNNGGLITLTWHAYNPWHCDGLTWCCENVDPCWQNTDNSVGNPADIYTPGNWVYERWRKDLDQKARWLTQLKNAGVVVLWRPFHEMNLKGSFWWNEFSKEEYINLWRDMFNYYTDPNGWNLNNLLWVYAANKYFPGCEKVDYYYPGANYVDIVGLDFYPWSGESFVDINNFGYPELLALGKPFALTEFGPTGAFCGGSGITPPNNCFDYRQLINGIRTYCPKASYFMAWSEEWAIMNQNNGTDLLNDSWVVTRDEVDWRLGTPPTTFDLDQNGLVNNLDFSWLITNLGLTSFPQGDFNQNGKIDTGDMVSLLSHWGKW